MQNTLVRQDLGSITGRSCNARRIRASGRGAEFGGSPSESLCQQPDDQSQRAQLRAIDELVPQALSGYRPTVEAGADAVNSNVTTRLTPTAREAARIPAARERAGRSKQKVTLQSRTVDLSIVQPLYSGGRTQAETKRAEALVQAQRVDLLSTEQTVLLDGQPTSFHTNSVDLIEGCSRDNKIPQTL